MGTAAQPPSTCSSLLIRLRDPRDDGAWRMFVDLYSPMVFGYAQRRGLQNADAEDVTQQVFAKVNQAIRGFEYDPNRGRFRSWLGTIVAQAIGRHLGRVARKDRAVGELPEDDLLDHQPGMVEPEWLDEFNAQICQAALVRIQGEFDADVWRAFELTWIDDQASVEVAAMLNKPVAWVYKARFNVQRRLEEELQFLTADTAYFTNEP
jgi:RNA polymerase sigma-70 factor (ECF subfamily)